MDKEEQELKIRIAQKTRPLKATINALNEEISGLNLYRKKQNKEIAALKAEIERLNSIVNWEKTEAEYYAKLGKENDRLEAEIEQKDGALMECASSADSIRFHCGHGGDLDIIFALAGDIMNRREQAMRVKEE